MRVVEEAASAQAERLGLADIVRVNVAHPIQDATDEEMHAKCDDVFDEIIAGAAAVVVAQTTASGAAGRSAAKL